MSTAVQTPPASTGERGRKLSRPAQGKGVPTWALKAIMAVTGITWALFVVIHLFGNLKVYIGADAFDTYAGWLREVFYPLVPHEGVLWIMRVVLVTFLILHVAGAFTLWSRARQARGPRKAKISGGRQWVAKLMLPTGIIIVVCLVTHVLDLTVGLQPIAPEAFVGLADGGSPHANLVAGFSRPWSAAMYVVWMLALCVHILHGTFVAINDFGATGARLRKVAIWVGAIAGIAILLGNASIPIAVQMGVFS